MLLAVLVASGISRTDRGGMVEMVELEAVSDGMVRTTSPAKSQLAHSRECHPGRAGSCVALGLQDEACCLVEDPDEVFVELDSYARDEGVPAGVNVPPRGPRWAREGPSLG